VKKYIYTVLILCICFTFSVFADERKAYKSPLYNFELSYPNDWQAKEISGIVVFLSPLESLDDKFSENVNVVVENVAAYPLNSEEYAKVADEYWLSLDPKIKIIDFQKSTIGGQDAFYTVAIDGTYKYKQYKFVNSGNAYVLTYTSEPDKFDKFLDIADNIIRSFRVR
jgi:eukaryotic-like serine/threonine-protein kinase